MATKTISLKLEAYERLKRARRYPGESFSEVVLRADWPERTITAGELLERARDPGALLSFEELAAAEAVAESDRPPEDKWSTG